MKKRLSLFFALILILSVLPVYAAADGDAPSPAEEALRLAIKNGETEYTLSDDLTLSGDLILPVKFTLTLWEGCTLTVPDGVALKVRNRLFVFGSVIVADGGRLLLDSIPIDNAITPASVYVLDGGALAVDAGGKLENDGYLFVQNDAAVRVDGDYTVITKTFDEDHGAEIYPALTYCVPCDSAEIDLPGIPPELVTLHYEVYSEEELLSALSQAETFSGRAEIYIISQKITLHSDTVIGKNVRLELMRETEMTVPQGVTLINRGMIWAIDRNVRVTAEAGSEVQNSGIFYFYSENNVFEIQEGAVLRTIDDPNALRFGPGTILICNGTQEKLAGHITAMPRVTEPAVEGPVAQELFIDGPESLETEAWGVYTVCAYAENGDPLHVSDMEWELFFMTDATPDLEFYHGTGELYTGTSPGEIVLQATTEYGTCEKTVTIVQRTEPLTDDERVRPSEREFSAEDEPFTPGLFIEGPDSLGAKSQLGYNVCAYDENGEMVYHDAEWSIVETDIADAAVDAETGLLYTGSSPGKIVLRATTVYGWGTYEKTVTVGPYEEPPMEGGLELPEWAIVLVLAVLLAAIVFAVVRIVIAVRRRNKKKTK